MSPSEPLSLTPDGLGPPSRELGAGDLVFANRLITLELVLPNITHEINNALQVIGRSWRNHRHQAWHLG